MKSGRLRVLFGMVAVAGLMGLSQVAQAGILRYTGRHIAAGASVATQAAAVGGAAVAQGTVAAGHATAGAAASGLTATKNGVAVAAGSVAAAGTVAGGAVAQGASGAANSIKGAPSAVNNAVQSAAHKVYHVVW